ncbi:MAG: galactose-1-phosphate uridylyltransferase [Pseudomonadota bacterium]
MPELRKDPIVGRWVIISKERGKRPSDFCVERAVSRGGFCPFCPGNEHTTPPEVMAYGRDGGRPDTSGWTLRVTPNKFPALVIEGNLDKQGEGLYDKMSGIGAHEVIIESPTHNDTLATVSVKKFAEILQSYRDRLIDLSRDMRFKYILVFKNFGEKAGASLEHTHSQLIALPVLPELVVEELSGAREYFRYKERCVFCDIVRQELLQGTRIVGENQHFIAATPYAPRSPFETWILPKRHVTSYVDMWPDEYWSLAELFSETMRRLDKALCGCAYNFVLHTSPLRDRELEYYHWHFEIMPKLTLIAGFEWGSGFFINPTPPEDAAKYLREVQL